jgi:hypothetical protein
VALASPPHARKRPSFSSTLLLGSAGAQAASAPAALEAAGVSAEAVASKARMTALLAACASATSGEVKLSDLQVGKYNRYVERCHKDWSRLVCTMAGCVGLASRATCTRGSMAGK